MARVNAQQWLQKWATNLNAAGPFITSGVQRVSVAPGQSAAAAADRMLAGVTASLQSGKWQRNVSAVSLQQWQDAMIKKGIPRLQQGTAQAINNKTQAITTLLTNVDAAVAVASALPKGGLEQGIARAAAFMRAMHTASQSK